jgi:hypothetical protein
MGLSSTGIEEKFGKAHAWSLGREKWERLALWRIVRIPNQYRAYSGILTRYTHSGVLANFESSSAE